jgi:hypothetical protein
VTPVSKPAVDGKTHDALLAENAALKAQIALNTGGRATGARAAGNRRRARTE